MNIISEVISATADTLIVWLTLDGFLQPRKVPRIGVVFSYVAYAVFISALNLFTTSPTMRVGVNCVFMFCLTLGLYQSRVLIAIFLSVAFKALYILTSSAMLIILSLGPIRDETLLLPGGARIAYLVATHCVLLALVLSLITITRKNKVVTPRFLTLLVPGWITCFLYGIMMCHFVRLSEQDLPIGFSIIAIGLLYMNFLIVFYAEKLNTISCASQEAALQENHYKMQESYYQQLYAEHEEIRILRHDIGKYLLAMQALTAEGKIAESDAILLQAKDVLYKYDALVDVGNSVLNVFLSEYLRRATDAGVALKLDIQVPQSLKIETVDLYILLGNTLDNAISACKNLAGQQRVVKLQLRMHNDILFCQIENPYRETLCSDNRKKGHGYGLENVRRCLEKYNGNMELERDNGCFFFRAHLNNERGKSV